MRTEIVINPKYQYLSPFVHSVRERFEKEGETIYKARNEIKVFEVDGELINVKRFQVPHLINRIAYTFIRPSKAKRSYQYGFILHEKGVYTPEPIATITIYRRGVLYYSYFISKQLDTYQAMYDILQRPAVEIQPFIKDLAQFAVYLHESGIFHKDFSPGNVLYEKQDDGYRFCLVDINRMEFGSPVSVQKGCSNFARLWGKEDVFVLLAKEYAKGRGANEEECVQWVLKQRKLFWKQFALKHDIPFEFE
ncbi:serine/threonine protein kinase [Parabacteroides sp. PFB2-10]|uniref:lipopolysaccharide kinase InaA family protein n=1 Tax=Parabacteroides sp. PFB2-10 TaxID=1742405 RepID=UPI0024761BD3|nr:lipopolysaccharide kinase InaA family protein [Parabacteroides sp. PFB2-10]MDH6312573.1 serine/threonine protein kinase [Parabacteroides sp. PFB2-10]